MGEHRVAIWAAVIGAIGTVLAAMIGVLAVRGTTDGPGAKPVPSTATTSPMRSAPAPTTLSAPTTPPSSPVNSSADELHLPAALVGTWLGVVTQGSEKYPVTLVLKGGTVGDVVGTSTYTTLECKATLTLLSGGADVVLQERPNSACVTIEMRLSLDSDGTLSYSEGPADDPICTATLRRR